MIPGRPAALLIAALMLFMVEETVLSDSEGILISLDNRYDEPGESVDIHLEFDKSSIEFVDFSGFSYMTAPGYSIPFDEGNAALPLRTIRLIVHPFSENLEINIGSLSSQSYRPHCRIAGVPEPVPYSSDKVVLPEEPERYPKDHLQISGEGFTRGLRILDIDFHPVIMTDEGLSVVSELDAAVSFDIGEHYSSELGVPFRRDSSAFKRNLEKDLINPQDIDRFPAMRSFRPMGKISTDDIQYVIITNTSKTGDGFEDLADWKTSKGVPARIVETSFIDDNYDGTDMAERIRNFIKDAVASWDTEFVLMGGDVSAVAYRGAYARTYSSTQTSNACDLYFSDLDGTWNADNDGYWGETSDGTDLRPDVYVGRAPVQNSQETSTFVAKTLLYETDPPSGYLDNATFAGEYLDDTTNSSIGMDLIKNNLMPASSNVTSLYDSGKGDFGNLNRLNFMNQVDNGASLVYHAGHCNWNVMSVGTAGTGSLYNSHVSSYKSEGKYGVLNTVGCIANKFNQDDCIVERHVKEPDGGTVAGIGNSHYGWYAYGYPGFGPSEQYMYQMTGELFVNEVTSMGGHFAEGKNNYVSQSGTYNSARWLQIVLNLIGDPETPVRTAEPLDFNITMPNTTGKDFTGFPVMVRSENGTPVKNALVCLEKSDFYSYRITNETGLVTFDFHTENIDPLNVTVTAYNHMPFRKNLSLDLILPTISLNGDPVGTTGDDMTLNCTVSDEAGVRNVNITRIDENSTIDLHREGEFWKGNMSIPLNSTEDIRIRINAMDGSGNLNTTDYLNITVIDDDTPSISEDRTHFDAYTGDPFEFSGLFTDNIAVESVIAEHWSESEHPVKEVLSNKDGKWTGTYRTRDDYTGIRYYRFIVMDPHGNTLLTDPSTYVVHDNDRPHNLTDLSDKRATTSDPFSLRLRADDNTGIESAYAEWWKDDWNLHNNDTMTDQNGTWTLDLTGDPSDLSPVKYIFRVVDINGNWNFSGPFTIDISDNDQPMIWDDMTEKRVNSGEELSFSIKARDNVGLETVSVIYDWDGMDSAEIDLEHGTGDLWGSTIRIPEDVTGEISYMYRALDVNGLVNETIQYRTTVVDRIDPSCGDLIHPSSVAAGKHANFTVTAFDNIGIGNVTLYWWIGGMDPSAIIMEGRGGEYRASVKVPLEAYGTLYVQTSVSDVSGNVVDSERKGVLIIEYIHPEPEEKKPRIPVAGEDMDRDGMDDLWEYINGLDLDSNDTELDPDDDGFSNFEEYIEETDPNDPESHPVIEQKIDDELSRGILIIAGTFILVLFAVFIIFLIAMRTGKKDTTSNEPGMMHAKHHRMQGYQQVSEADHDGKHPYHSFPLDDDGIRHPHHHPTHPEQKIRHQNEEKH